MSSINPFKELLKKPLMGAAEKKVTTTSGAAIAPISWSVATKETIWNTQQRYSPSFKIIEKYEVASEHSFNFNSETVKQIGAFSPRWSDHLAWQIEVNGIVFDVHNQMMPMAITQAQTANNAFGLTHESPYAYAQRLQKQNKADLDKLEGDIAQPFVFFKQEGTATNSQHQHYNPVKQFKGSFTDTNSSWGVNAYAAGVNMYQQALALDPKILERCRSYKIINPKNNQSILATNVHLPHPKPIKQQKSQSEAAKIDDGRLFFKKVIEQSIKQAAQNINQNKPNLTHALMGDWNLEPQVMEALMNEVAELFKDQNIQISATFYSSQEGHLKTSGETLSVDGALILSVQPSKRFEYKFTKAPVEKASALLLAAMVVGGSAFINNHTEEIDSSVEHALDSPPLSFS